MTFSFPKENVRSRGETPNYIYLSIHLSRYAAKQNFEGLSSMVIQRFEADKRQDNQQPNYLPCLALFVLIVHCVAAYSHEPI